MTETRLERYRRLAREIRNEIRMISDPKGRQDLEAMARQYDKFVAEEEAREQEQSKDAPDKS